MKRSINKKGFSLVELIIVIAIMAILVGFMAPMLIKYIEKTKISSDTQLADSIRSCLLVSITDARILEDPASQPYLTDMEDGNGMDIASASWTGGSVLEESLKDSLGCDMSTLPSQIRSKTDGSPTIMVYTDNNKVQVVITGTDVTGKGNYSADNWITVD